MARSKWEKRIPPGCKEFQGDVIAASVYCVEDRDKAVREFRIRVNTLSVYSISFPFALWDPKRQLWWGRFPDSPNNKVVTWEADPPPEPRGVKHGSWILLNAE